MKRLAPLLGAVAMVVMVWVYLFPYSAALNNPNERTRVLQARAIVEKRQLAIGAIVAADPARPRRVRFVDLYGRHSDRPFVNDVAVTCIDPNDEAPRCLGALYPAKAPGTALLGVPGLWLAERFGFVPAGPAGESRATWVLRLSVMLFGLAGLLALGLLAQRAGASRAVAAATVLAAGLGTGLFPYSVQFVGHAAAGWALIIGAWLLADAKTVTRAALGGLAASSAVLFEYHAAPAVLALGGATLFLPGRRAAIPGFAIGAIFAFAVHAALHDAMFGHALRTGHMSLVTEHNRASQSGGFLGLDGFHPASLAAHLGDPYMGLLATAPWLVAALAGVPALLTGAAGPVGRAVLAAVGLYLLFVTGLGEFRTMNGWSFGPRYLTPALPFIALLAAVGLERLKARAAWSLPVGLGLAGASIVVFAALVAAYPSHPDDVRWPYAELALPLLAEGYGVRSLGVSLGSGWLWVYGALVLAALGALLRLGLGTRWHALAGAAALALALAAAAAFWRPTEAPRVKRALDFERSTVEGAAPSGARRFF